MIKFPEDHVLHGIQLTTVRLNLMNGVGNYAHYALVDGEGRPLAKVVSQKFSERTFRLIEALQESMENDAYAIYSQRPRGGDHPPDEDEGVSFG